MNDLNEKIRYALKRASLSQTAVAQRIGVTPQSVYKWIKTGKIDKANLQKLADITGLRIEWFLDTNERSWTPEDPDSLILQVPGVRPMRQHIELHPLISYAQAALLLDPNENIAPADAEDWLPWPYPCSNSTYALPVRGSSMETEFFENEIIFVDPQRTPKSGDFVVAKLELHREAALKKLLQEGDTLYLKAQNRDWPEPVVRLNESWKICGVVIGKFKKY
ncbi:LexA family protein [Pseudomonas fluorescens]|uniref:LexA family protein n=1 Tax=Pseudomonas fluorescens TaxID=294 RepID=UPI00192BEECD|nr:XRE family transcriptional regulator [Pseudomonas fluorescens]MBL4981728.1 helix-turn-helix domain-containing protein [Pseudomonas fluorescens]